MAGSLESAFLTRTPPPNNSGLDNPQNTLTNTSVRVTKISKLRYLFLRNLLVREKKIPVPKSQTTRQYELITYYLVKNNTHNLL